MIRIGYFLHQNFGFDCRIDPNSGSLIGFSTEIVDLLQRKIHFQFEYVLLNETSKKTSRQTDVILCNPNVQFENYVRLHETIRSNYVLLYKPTNLSFSNDIFMLTFTGTLWLCFLLLMVLLGICLKISTKKYHEIHSENQQWSWVDITLWAIAAACQQGLSHSTTKFASCCIFLLGYLTAYLLNTGFAAGITSLLLGRNYNYDLNVNYLRSKHINVVNFPGLDDLGVHYDLLNGAYTMKSLDQLFREINKRNTIGVAPKVNVEQYISNRTNIFNLDEFAMLTIPNAVYRRGILVLKNCSLIKTFNTELLLMKGSGVLDVLLRRHILPKKETFRLSEYSSVGIEHVGSAIIILASGMLACIFFLMCEFIFAYYETYHSKLVN